MDGGYSIGINAEKRLSGGLQKAGIPLRRRFPKEGQAVRYGQLTLERARPAGLFALGIRFFLAAALTASQTPGGYAPFSLGLEQ